MRPEIGYALAKAVEEGHCGLPVSHLLRLTADLIEVPAALIETALALELGAGETIADTVGGQSYVFLAGSIMPSKGIVTLAANGRYCHLMLSVRKRHPPLWIHDSCCQIRKALARERR